MKSIYLISYQKQIGPKFLAVELKEKLDSYNDILKDAVKHSSSVLDIKEAYSASKVAPNFINFSKINLKKEEVEIESPTTKKLLATKGKLLTVIALCENLLGKRIGLLYTDPNGCLGAMSIKSAVTNMRNRPLFTNVFCRDNTVVPFESVVKNLPIIKVGTRLTEEKVKNVETIKEPAKKLSESAVSKLRAPLKAMNKYGFYKYVEAFRLNNQQYSDETLWFYFELMMDDEVNIVANMLTTENFNYYQLREIADGLRLGLDVHKYSDPGLDALEMEKIKNALSTGIWSSAMIPLPMKLKAIKDPNKAIAAKKALSKKLNGKGVAKFLGKK